MEITYFIFAVIFAYMLGSIPTAVWVGKIFYNIDVRGHGSGNAGATNTFRVLGVKAGIPVLLIDLLKGWGAVNLVHLLSFIQPETNTFINAQLALGVASVIGHIFPLWAKFKGGKGVATLAGLVLALHPIAALLTMTVFITILLISRYVSLSSMLAGLTFPILIIGYFKITSIPLIVFSLAIAILLLVTHKKNIKRLIKKEESKANLFNWKKKKVSENNNKES